MRSLLLKFKNDNGITLLALALTVVIMVTLVSTTVTIAFRNGLFEHAKMAVQAVNNTIDREKNQTNQIIKDDLEGEALEEDDDNPFIAGNDLVLIEPGVSRRYTTHIF